MSIQNGYYLTVTANGSYSVNGDSCFIISATANSDANCQVKFLSAGTIEVTNFSSFGYIKLWVFYA